MPDQVLTKFHIKWIIIYYEHTGCIFLFSEQMTPVIKTENSSEANYYSAQLEISHFNILNNQKKKKKKL